jgi:Ca2+ transporting ATPase
MVIASLTLHDPPFSVLQVIWLSLIHDIFSSIALAFEPPLKKIGEKHPPVRKGENIVNE